MLRALKIRNFILIDELDLNLKPGLCVITGETGAGKSIILEALLFSLGKKPRSLVTRNINKITIVESIFDCSGSAKIKEYLDKNSIIFNSEICIKRTQQGSIKKSYINNQLVSGEALEYIANNLFEIYGQNNHTTLLNPATHIDILDNVGQLIPVVIKVNILYKAIQNLKNQIKEAEKDRCKIIAEIDYLTFSIAEITKLNIISNEEEQLIKLQDQLKNKEKYNNIISEITKSFDEPPILTNIAKSLKLLMRKHNVQINFEEVTVSLEKAYFLIENVIAELKQKILLPAYSDNDIDQVEERLSIIKQLSFKHKVPSNNFDKFLATLTEQLSVLEGQLASGLKANENLTHQIEQYNELAGSLSKSRIVTAKFLVQKVQKHLSELNMEKAKFNIEVNADPDIPTNKGIDKVRFIASTNPGMPAGAINKIASGGELSRFMLALKTAILNKDHKPLNIFDEIDSGTSTTVAANIGSHLKKLSSLSQVLVITHQPQIAAKADQHILIQKDQLNDTTVLTATDLDNNQRITELARMISGARINKHSLDLAISLLT